MTWRRGHRGGGSTLIRLFPTGWGVGGVLPPAKNLLIPPTGFLFPPVGRFWWITKSQSPHLKFSSYNPWETAFLAVVMAVPFLFFFHAVLWFPSLESPLTPYCYFENPACAHNFRNSPSFVTPLKHLAFSFLHAPDLSLIMNYTLTKL